jgi:hypothetical protein
MRKEEHRPVMTSIQECVQTGRMIHRIFTHDGHAITTEFFRLDGHERCLGDARDCSIESFCPVKLRPWTNRDWFHIHHSVRGIVALP